MAFLKTKAPKVHKKKKEMFGCFLFVCFFVPLENVSLICRRYHCRWRAAYFELRSALMASEQWGFFNVPYLLWHGASIYNGHLRRSVDTHTYCQAFSRRAVNTCFYDLGMSLLGFEHPTFCLGGKRFNRSVDWSVFYFNFEFTICQMQIHCMLATIKVYACYVVRLYKNTHTPQQKDKSWRGEGQCACPESHLWIEASNFTFAKIEVCKCWGKGGENWQIWTGVWLQYP